MTSLKMKFTITIEDGSEGSVLIKCEPSLTGLHMAPTLALDYAMAAWNGMTVEAQKDKACGYNVEAGEIGQVH